MKFENKNQKGESKMENENQKPKLSFKDVFKIRDEICSSQTMCDGCPFQKGNYCIVRDGDMAYYADEIETICTEWEKNKPTLAEKVNEILKPYGMKLENNNHYIWFDDDYKGLQTKSGLMDKLYTTKWKGELNE